MALFRLCRNKALTFACGGEQIAFSRQRFFPDAK